MWEIPTPALDPPVRLGCLPKPEVVKYLHEKASVFSHYVQNIILGVECQFL